MKKLFLLLGAMMTFFGAQTANAQNTFVDLGLPSGTLWATCNVGADNPAGDGYYLAWGETFEKSTYYDWEHYKYCKGTSKTLTKYCTVEEWSGNISMDGLTELLPEDDAATVNWGFEWQMPSKAQFEELFNSGYTTTEWTTLNGKNGMRITSKSNGRSIFLPASGYKVDYTRKFYGEYGLYMSRSIHNQYPATAYTAYFIYGDSKAVDNYGREAGYSVRPVRVQDEYTIYNIPEGWKVNGTTTSGTYQAKGGDAVHFTPKNIPSGKKIKSIKVVKK